EMLPDGTHPATFHSYFCCTPSTEIIRSSFSGSGSDYFSGRRTAEVRVKCCRMARIRQHFTLTSAVRLPLK
ncbi:hypothetical protein PSY30_23705, partial [Shigella flexneri]|nr:hypothetical protein [Shigella flexneri]